MTKAEKRKTDKVLQMVEWLDEANLLHAQLVGGYPPETAIVGQHVVMASVEEDEPQLTVWTFAQMRRWHDEVAASMEVAPEEDVHFHVNDNWQEGIR